MTSETEAAYYIVRPNPNLYPDGGYFFLEGDGTRFRGESWRDLIAKVTKYREVNKRPVGNPEEDVFAQYCARIPSHCKQMTAPAPPSHHSITLNQRVLQASAKLMERKRKAAIPRVTDTEAIRRAEICKRCPFYKPLVRSCEACIRTLESARKVILDKNPSQHQDLLACGALGEDLVLTVHIEQPAATGVDLPVDCWRR